MLKNEKQTSYYSFFTRYSLMQDYGLSSGIMNRLVKKIIPSVPPENSFEFFLLKNKKDIDYILSSIDFDGIKTSHIPQELILSIKALCSKISAFGLDNNICNKFKVLGIETASFELLLSQIAKLDSADSNKFKDLQPLLETIEKNIHLLRKHKNKIGVSFHLTTVTRKILEYCLRVKDLVELELNIDSRVHWERLIRNHIHYIKRKDSLRQFIFRHIDLLVLVVVEHTSNKGEKYIAEDNKEYWRFLYRSMFGGILIAFFALLKIHFGTYQFDAVGKALIYSLNYAACFIITKHVGGIIATKQPAMTASTIAKNIDKNDDLRIDSINETVSMIKRAMSSQFISLVGNFTMALFAASVTFLIFELFGSQDVLNIEPEYLLKEVMPSLSLIGYAATAGVFLALSGLISGFVDNKVIASKAAYRIAHSNLFFNSNRFARFVQKKGGALMGNFSLGFFLGCAFLLSYIFPLSIDIRHIAFSTSYVGYSLMSHPVEIVTIIKALLGIMLIGITNLIVSFSITLYLALKSRGAEFSFIPQLLFQSVKDFIRNPLEYFIIKKK